MAGTREQARNAVCFAIGSQVAYGWGLKRHMVLQNDPRANPLVSILIPCYNAEPWIRHCIESALAQTYAPTEVIVADDGSTDGSVSIIESFGPQVRLERLNHGGANV